MWLYFKFGDKPFEKQFVRSYKRTTFFLGITWCSMLFQNMNEAMPNFAETSVQPVTSEDWHIVVSEETLILICESKRGVFVLYQHSKWKYHTFSSFLNEITRIQQRHGRIVLAFQLDNRETGFNRCTRDTQMRRVYANVRASPDCTRGRQPLTHRSTLHSSIHRRRVT